MNVTTLMDRLSTVTITVPGATSDSTGIANTDNSQNGTYASELKKTLKKNNEPQPTNDSRPAPKDSNKPPVESSDKPSPSSQREEKQPRVEKNAPVSQEDVDSSNDSTQAPPIAQSINNTQVSTTSTSSINVSLDDVAIDLSINDLPAPNAETETSTPDLQEMLEALIKQLEELTTQQKPSENSTDKDNSSKPNEAVKPTDGIPLGLQQAVQQVFEQAEKQTSSPEPANQAKQAIDMIEALITKLGTEEKEDEETEDEQTSLEDDLSEIQALLQQLTGQSQVADEPVEVTSVQQNVWGDVVIQGAPDQSQFGNSNSPGTPEPQAEKLPEIQVESDSTQTKDLEEAPVPELELEAISPSNDEPVVSQDSAEPLAESKTTETDESTNRIETTGPTRSESEVKSSVSVKEADGARQTATIQLIEKVSQAISTGTTKNDQSFRMQIGAGDLGQLQIEVTSHKGSVSAVIHAEQPSTHKLLLEHISHLKESLSLAGHNVEKIQIETSPEGSMFEDFTRQESAHSGQQNDDQNDFATGLFDLDGEETSSSSTKTTKQTSRNINSRDQLDIAI